jgi:(E)-4-hydroxy-3-methylbut-2-enyl-diphosphate synthase
MQISRKKTRQINIGSVVVGGDAPVCVQSMTNTKTTDIEKTLKQIKRLEIAGCELVRLSVPDEDSAKALPKIKSKMNVPLIADVHFDWNMAIMAMQNGADCIRINPGNMRDEDITNVAKEAKKRGISMRIGVNAGSLRKDILDKHGHPTPEALVESAVAASNVMEKAGFQAFKISVKASQPLVTIDAYRLLSEKSEYPLHVGVSEAGPFVSGTVKSSVGLGILLSEGIGDTMRVSLTADPVDEVVVAREILSSLGLLSKLNITSCPTCARTSFDLIELVDDVQEKLAKGNYPPITVAIMGCIVNGPGEAREADIGLAAGKGKGAIFKNGEVIRTVKEDDYLDELLREIEKIKKDWEIGTLGQRD